MKKPRFLYTFIYAFLPLLISSNSYADEPEKQIGRNPHPGGLSAGGRLIIKKNGDGENGKAGTFARAERRHDVAIGSRGEEEVVERINICNTDGKASWCRPAIQK